MPVAESFARVQVEYFRLRDELTAGRLTPAQFAAAVNTLRLDYAGHPWQIDASSGEWYYYDGRQWLAAPPPQVAPLPAGGYGGGYGPVPVAPPPVYPPPPAYRPARRASCGGVFLRIAGVLLSLVLAASIRSSDFRTAVGNAVLHARDRIQTAPSTVTPSPLAVSVAAGVTVTAGQRGTTVTPVTLPAFPVTIAPRSVTVTPAAGPMTWTDPRRLVSLHYPSTWHLVQTTDPANVLRLTGPDGIQFNLVIDDHQPGTLDQEVANARTSRSQQMQYTFMFGPATDLKIGGEPAKLLPETYRDKSQPNAPAASERDWIVNHGGKAFYFSAAPIGMHSMDVDAIIASITFLT